MTSTNDGKDVKINQTSGPKGKTYYIELYKSLEARLTDCGDASERTQHLCEAWRRVHCLCQHSAPSTHTHLLIWLQRHTARAVLQTEWQSPKRKDDRKSLEDAINAFIAECEEAKAARGGVSTAWEGQLVARGEWFKKVLDRPWDHPCLTLLLNPNGTPPTDDEVLTWLKEERGVTFVMRLHVLVGEKCDDIAVSLAAAVMERARAAALPDPDAADEVKDEPENAEPTFADKLREEAGFTLDVWDTLTDIEFVLLHKRDSKKCIALAKQTPLAGAYHLIERLQKRLEIAPREKRMWKNAKEVAVLIAQVVIARCMMIPVCAGAARSTLYCCARLLARLSARARLPAAADALAATAPTARHLHTLAAAVDKQLTPTNESMRPYVCELYVRAITAGMNELERLKLKTDKEQETEARTMEKTLASWFVQLGSLLAASDRVQCECALTAFSLHPSPSMYERLHAAPHVAPLAAPLATDADNSKEETVNSEFGSWANDSRGQTNFVKTSETLNMKHTQNQANILSTAIFNEGEALGLSPELCQDIAVLLSGPRVKTLSWDMDRGVLLDYCRAYMERTNGGTRVLTRELKYLNLDPNQYQHLPEERDDDENDPHYGIERGYEHLVPEDPVEIWGDEASRTESASSSIEYDFIAPRRKKKIKREPLSSEDDSDPLSVMAESKRVQKKKERPHSKERSKERAKKKDEPTDPLQINLIQKEKKPKEKKERKKKEKVPKVKTGKSLANLIGIKVVKTKKKPIKDTNTVISPVTDSDYDSQGKCSLHSMNSEGNDNSLLDGLQSLDEHKSAQRKSSHNSDSMGLIKDNEFYVQSGKVGIKGPPSHTYTHATPRVPNNLHKMSYRPSTANTIHRQPPGPSRNMSPNFRASSDGVRTTISKLLDFRRQRAAMALNNKLQNTPRKPAIFRQNIPIQTNISPKAVAIPDIPKSYINKQHAEKLAELKREVNNLLAAHREKTLNKTLHSAVPSPVIQFAKKNEANKTVTKPVQHSRAQQPNVSSPKMTDFVNVPYDRLMAEISERQNSGSGHCNIVKQPATPQHQPTQSNMTLQRTWNGVSAGQRDYQNFLKEYEQSKYMTSSKTKNMKPVSKVTPVVPKTSPKVEQKASQCAKQSIQQKKPENSLNTFSRLSYMHKNKQTEMNNKQSLEKSPQFTTETYQEVSSELDKIIKEHQRAQMKVIQAKSERSDKLLAKTANANNAEFIKNYDTSRTQTWGLPVLTNLLQQTPTSTSNTSLCGKESQMKNTQMQQKPISPKTSPLEKELLHLLRQQHKLNAPINYSTNNYSTPSTSRAVPGNNSSMANYNSLSSQNQQQFGNTASSGNTVKSSFDKKLINIISNSLIKPAHDVNSMNYVSKTKSSTKSNKETDSQTKVNKSVANKEKNSDKPIPETEKPEWQAVMSDLLRHKTPCRGPNALAVALNKSSFEQAFEKSLQQPSIFYQPQQSESISENNLESNKRHVKVHPPKPATSAIHNVITSSNKEVKTHAEQSKVSSDKIKYSNLKKPNMSMNGLLLKQNPPEIAKTLPQEFPRKQFTYAVPKHDDPFISGLPNSDYDLLEELMDDDLRKEIGELSSDDESYNAAAQSFLQPTKSDQKRVSVEFNKPLNDIAAKKTDARCLNARQTTQEIPQQPVKCGNRMTHGNNTIQVPQRAADNKTQDNTSYKTSTAQNVSNVPPTPKRQNQAYKSYNNVETLTSSQTAIDPNIYITSVPPPAPLHNVVLIGSELVYESYSTVQTPMLGVSNIAPNAYATINSAPNMTVYQTTQYVAPLVNPLIIGSSMTVPIVNNVTCATIPVQTNSINIVAQPVYSASTVEQQTEAPCPRIVVETCNINADMSNHVPVADCLLEKKQLDVNKTNERKVLSEVQEKLAVTEKIDKARSQKIDYDIKNKKDSSADQERLKRKRLAIINREIYHRCGDTIIPLTYSPLPLKKTITKKHSYSEAIPLTYTSLQPNEDKQMSSDFEEEKELLTQIKNNLQDMSDAINKIESPATPDSNESKENESIPAMTCRRILLRSSNKIAPKSNVSIVATKSEILTKQETSTKKKIKIISDIPVTPDKVRNASSQNNPDVKEAITQKRASKRLRNKTITVTKDVEKVPVKHQCQKSNPRQKVLPRNKASKLIEKTDTTALSGINNETKILDIEAELLGSKISKSVSDNNEKHVSNVPTDHVVDKEISVNDDKAPAKNSKLKTPASITEMKELIAKHVIEWKVNEVTVKRVLYSNPTINSTDEKAENFSRDERIYKDAIQTVPLTTIDDDKMVIKSAAVTTLPDDKDVVQPAPVTTFENKKDVIQTASVTTLAVDKDVIQFSPVTTLVDDKDVVQRAPLTNLADDKDVIELAPGTTLKEDKDIIQLAPVTTLAEDSDDIQPAPVTTSADDKDVIESVPEVTLTDNKNQSAPVTTWIDNKDIIESPPVTTPAADMDVMQVAPVTTLAEDNDVIQLAPATTSAEDNDAIQLAPLTTLSDDKDVIQPAPVTTLADEKDVIQSVPETTIAVDKDVIQSIPATNLEVSKTNDANILPIMKEAISEVTANLATAITSPIAKDNEIANINIEVNDQKSNESTGNENIDLDMSVTCEEESIPKMTPVYTNIKNARNKTIHSEYIKQVSASDAMKKEKMKTRSSQILKDDIEKIDLEPVPESWKIINPHQQKESAYGTSVASESDAIITSSKVSNTDDDVVLIDDDTNQTPELIKKPHKSLRESKSTAETSLIDVNETSELSQSFKDSIEIENLPSGDPLKKIVRISLPNGRKFKATVYGEVYVNIDTLFSYPSIKAALLTRLHSKNFLTMNVKQITTVAKNNPRKVLSAQIHDIKPPALSEPMETIDLLSDDEDDCASRAIETDNQAFETEYGMYKIAPIDKDLFTKHQNKFSQQSRIMLKKVNPKAIINVEMTNKGKIYPSTNVFSAIPEVHVLGLIKDVENTRVKNTTPPVVPEIVEIEDSSNDSIYHGNTFENKKPDEKINELKNVLLMELGVGDNLIQTFKKNSQNNRLDNIDNNTPIVVEGTDSFIDSQRVSEVRKLSLIPTDECCPFDALDREEQLKITNRKCYIKLVRCDDLVNMYEKEDQKAIEKISAIDSFDEPLTIAENNSIITDLEINKLESEPIIITEDYSILNDLDMNIFESDARSSSPVIELSDVLVSLDDVSLKPNGTSVQQVISVSCEANWYTTKRALHLQSLNDVFLHSQVFVQKNKEIDEKNPTSCISNKKLTEAILPEINDAASLTSLVLKCFQNTTLIHRYRLVSNYMSYPHFSLLKRKSTTLETPTASKISKLQEQLVDPKVEDERLLSSIVTLDSSEPSNVCVCIDEDTKIISDLDKRVDMKSFNTTFEPGKENIQEAITSPHTTKCDDNHNLNVQNNDKKQVCDTNMYETHNDVKANDVNTCFENVSDDKMETVDIVTEIDNKVYIDEDRDDASEYSSLSPNINMTLIADNYKNSNDHTPISSIQKEIANISVDCNVDSHCCPTSLSTEDMEILPEEINVINNELSNDISALNLDLEDIPCEQELIEISSASKIHATSQVDTNSISAHEVNTQSLEMKNNEHNITNDFEDIEVCMADIDAEPAVDVNIEDKREENSTQSQEMEDNELSFKNDSGDIEIRMPDIVGEPVVDVNIEESEESNLVKASDTMNNDNEISKVKKIRNESTASSDQEDINTFNNEVLLKSNDKNNGFSESDELPEQKHEYAVLVSHDTVLEEVVKTTEIHNNEIVNNISLDSTKKQGNDIAPALLPNMEIEKALPQCDNDNSRNCSTPPLTEEIKTLTQERIDFQGDTSIPSLEMKDTGEDKYTVNSIDEISSSQVQEKAKTSLISDVTQICNMHDITTQSQAIEYNEDNVPHACSDDIEVRLADIVGETSNTVNIPDQNKYLENNDKINKAKRLEIEYVENHTAADIHQEYMEVVIKEPLLESYHKHVGSTVKHEEPFLFRQISQNEKNQDSDLLFKARPSEKYPEIPDHEYVNTLSKATLSHINERDKEHGDTVYISTHNGIFILEEESTKELEEEIIEMRSDEVVDDIYLDSILIKNDNQRMEIDNDHNCCIQPSTNIDPSSHIVEMENIQQKGKSNSTSNMCMKSEANETSNKSIESNMTDTRITQNSTRTKLLIEYIEQDVTVDGDNIEERLAEIVGEPLVHVDTKETSPAKAESDVTNTSSNHDISIQSQPMDDNQHNRRNDCDNIEERLAEIVGESLINACTENQIQYTNSLVRSSAAINENENLEIKIVKNKVTASIIDEENIMLNNKSLLESDNKDILITENHSNIPSIANYVTDCENESSEENPSTGDIVVTLYDEVFKSEKESITEPEENIINRRNDVDDVSVVDIRSKTNEEEKGNRSMIQDDKVSISCDNDCSSQDADQDNETESLIMNELGDSKMDESTNDSVDKWDVSIINGDNEEEATYKSSDVSAETIARKYLTLIGNDSELLEGIEYEDSEIGTCYVIPVIEKSSKTDIASIENSEDILTAVMEGRGLDTIAKMKDDVSIGSSHKMNQPTLPIDFTENYNDIEERLAKIVGETVTNPNTKKQIPFTSEGLSNITSKNDEESKEPDTDNFKVMVPKHTYGGTEHIRRRWKNLKRKIDMSDTKTSQRKYRKGKNIDNPKITAAAMCKTVYAKEYKLLFDYCSSVKFSYAIPFHKDYIDVLNTHKCWPIKNNHPVEAEGPTEANQTLFTEIEKPMSDPMEQTLSDEIISEYKEDYKPSNIDETNFNMGFGERSGRVIQELKDGEYTTFSAATLSDVKQLQPVLPSDEQGTLYKSQNRYENQDQDINTTRFVNYLNLRQKVRSFFEKTKAELTFDYKVNSKKDNFEHTHANSDWPFDLACPTFIEPASVEMLVNVVQVGQLPVSAAAQNPVTCDPRVTHVSNVSPSQCSPENSSGDDLQTTIKTEYTELTTADITLPLMQEYAQHHHSMPTESQESTNLYSSDETMPMATNVKIELMEETSQDGMDENEGFEDNDLQQFPNGNVNNGVQGHFGHMSNMAAESDPNAQTVTNSLEKPKRAEFLSGDKRHFNDQIAHAMNAAGIMATQGAVKTTSANALVDTLHQNAQSEVVTTSQANTNSYTKSTPINAIALQQALAQILPPPLNQTNASQNNQQPTNPQVLHIVQGNNAQSVINKPNGTQLLHIVQNKSAATTNGTPASQSNAFSGLSLVDGAIQQNGNQLLHIVNTGNQKNSNAGQLLKRVNLLTNLANVQGSNEQKMVQFVCKSADGKSIQLPHQRSMVLRLQTVDPSNVSTTPKQSEAQDPSPSSSTTHAINGKEPTPQDMKSRSLYEENYAKFVQNGDPKPSQEKATSLPTFNKVFGKQVYQDAQKEMENENLSENTECPQEENNVQVEQMNEISSPPLLTRKPQVQHPTAQPNLVQQIKQSIGPMNLQSMHGGVIYTRQIPVNLGNGQTINLITVPSTELVDDSVQKQQTDSTKFGNQEGDPPIIKIVQNQPASTPNGPTEDNNAQMGSSNEGNHQPNPTPQPQPVLTQMRIKLPMLSKAPQMVGGTRVVRPSFFQIQRNVIGGANQQVYQQLVLTAAPPLGQSIRLPAQTPKPKTPSETQSSPESQMSSSTLEQLREFDMVLEQVKERSTVQPGSSGSSSSSSNFPKINTSDDTTEAPTPSTSSQESSPTPVLYSVGNTQPLNMVNYVNRKSTITSTTTSSFVRSPDSTGMVDSPTSSTQSTHVPHTVISESCASSSCASEATATVQPKPKKKKPKPSTSNSNPFNIKNTPKPSSQKPLEDEQTTQRILYILAEYKEQVENSPDKDKPAPRRRNNPAAPNASGSSKRKKSSSGSRRRDMSPILGEDSCRTMGSEDSSCGTSLGECNECLESHSPEESPRKVVRRLTFEQETTQITTQTRTTTIPQRNVIVADGQAFAVRNTTGKPATTVLMPANYLLPVSMMKGGQQIAIVTNRGPKLLVGAGDGGTGGTLLFQRLIGPGGALKPVLTRPGVRHIRLPTAALHNLQAFNIATPATTVQPPDSTASPAPAPTPPDLVDTRAMSSPWPDRDAGEVKPETGNGNSSPEGSEPWNLPSSSSIADDYGYEEIVRTDNMDRTVLVVQRKDGRHTRLTHVSAAALRHKYAILEQELRLQKSLSEECEDLGVDSPSASELFPEAELLFAPSPAHEQTIDQCHTPQPTILQGIPPELEPRASSQPPARPDLDINLDDVGEIVTVGEDGCTTIPLDHEEFARSHEEFARSHPNTTFHSEPEDGEIPPFTMAQGLKGRQITFHARGAPGTVVMAPQTTVISQATVEAAGTQNTVKFTDIDNMINAMPSPQHPHHSGNMPSVLVKDTNDGLTKFDRLLNESRELHLSNTASAIVHSTGNGTQVIRRVHYETRRDARYLIADTDALISGEAKNVDERREMQSTSGDSATSPERHPELFWDTTPTVRPERRRFDFSSDSDKCCRSPYDENNSDSSGVGAHTRLDSVIKAARTERRRSDGSSADDNHPPLRTYPPKRPHQHSHSHHHTEVDRSLTGKTRAGDRCHEGKDESRRRASNRGVVKRGCHCCNGSTAAPKPKKSRPKKNSEFPTHN